MIKTAILLGQENDVVQSGDVLETERCRHLLVRIDR
jgi:hypothetical protein